MTSRDYEYKALYPNLADELKMETRSQARRKTDSFTKARGSPPSDPDSSDPDSSDSSEDVNDLSQDNDTCSPCTDHSRSLLDEEGSSPPRSSNTELQPPERGSKTPEDHPRGRQPRTGCDGARKSSRSRSAGRSPDTSSPLRRRHLHGVDLHPHSNRESLLCGGDNGDNVSKHSAYDSSTIYMSRSPEGMISIDKSPGGGKACLYKLSQDGMSKDGMLFLAVIFILFFIAGAFIFFRKGSLPEDVPLPYGPPSQEQILESFEEGLNKMKADFSEQTGYFWKVLHGQVRRIIRAGSKSTKPAILTIGYHDDDEWLLKCLTTTIEKTITESYKVQRGETINVIEKFKNWSPAISKEWIDDSLKEYFNKGSKVVIFHNLEELHAYAALMFHAYCDDQNGPFKDVVFIFTVRFPQTAELRVELIDDYLDERWKTQADEERVRALLSRVTNNNMVLTVAESGSKHFCANV